MDAVMPTSNIAEDDSLVKRVSMVRHDLRNPLGSMLGYLEMIDEDLPFSEDDPRHELIDQAVRTINEMLTAINGALDVSKINSGSTELRNLHDQLEHSTHLVLDIVVRLRSMPGFGVEEGGGKDLGRVERCIELFVGVMGLLDEFELCPLASEGGPGGNQPREKATGERAEGREAHEEEVPVAPELRTGTLLVVDDGEEYRELVGRRLKRLGFTVDFATSGFEALEAVSAKPIDLVLLDIVMPGLSGIETLARLKQSSSTKEIPVIMLSSADDSVTVVECIKRGADDFVPKPVNPTLLRARLESSLAKRRLRMASFAEAGFFYDRGTLRQDAPSYIERQSDRELLEGLVHGEYCYVLTSRQMGKSSLMVQTAARLRGSGVATVVLDLTAIGLNVTPEQWYDGLALRMAQQVRLDDELDDFWRSNERLSPVHRFFSALHEVVLAKVAKPVVVFVDELDTVRSLPFSTDEFFAAVRECHQRRAQDPVFGRLSFCLLGVATPFQLVRDPRVTPFNVARRIELKDFELADAGPLAKGLMRSPEVARALLGRVFYWTSGHPYLTQRLCRVIALDPSVREVKDVDATCKRLFLTPRAREEDDNLVFLRRQLTQGGPDRAAALRLYRLVREGKVHVPDDPESQVAEFLRFTGMVRSQDGNLVMRNRVYARAFDIAWIEQQEAALASLGGVASGEQSGDVADLVSGG